MIELPIFISLNLYGHKPAASHPWGLWGHKVVLGTFHKDVPQRVWFKRKYWNFQGFLHDLLRSKVTAIFNKALVKQQLTEKYIFFFIIQLFHWRLSPFESSYARIVVRMRIDWILVFFCTCHVHISCGLFSFFKIYYHISFSK